MSGVRSATGGDGWSTWTTERRGDDVTIRVTSNAEQQRGNTPSGWEPKLLHEEVMRDDMGRRAIDKAISISADYAHRMFT